MRKLFILFCLSLSLVAPKSFAYDVDTHFYGTYAMARYAGINHAVASRIATYAQWMDETYLSSPMVPTLLIGTKIRRLLHFPCTEAAGDFNNGSLAGLKMLSETVPNHPIASELITEGMNEGFLMKAAAGLHVMEDSYAHAGTPAETGHSHLWHWPDRPYASIPKYQEMVRTVFKVMVAIRTLLPENAIDFDLFDKARLSSANYKNTADALTTAYLSIPQLKATVEKNILVDPEYVRFAARHIVSTAQKQFNYFRKGFDAVKFLDEIQVSLDGATDTRQVIRNFALKLYEIEKSGSPILNKEIILKSYGFVANDPEYIKSWGSVENLIEAVVDEMLQGQVPTPLSELHKVEIEVEGPIREKEMEMRVNGMRKFIKDQFGINVRFTNNPVRHYYNRTKNPELLPKTRDEVVVTMDFPEQGLWNQMIYKYLFPSTYYAVDGPLASSLALGDTPWIVWDILNSRLIPKKENRYYQAPELFEKMVQASQVKSLISTPAVQVLRFSTDYGNQFDMSGALYK